MTGPDGAAAEDPRPIRHRVADAAVVRSTVWADRRVASLAVLAACGFALGLVTGQGAYAAAAAPAAVLLAWGSVHRQAPGIAVSVAEPPARVVEGDRWELLLSLTWAGPGEVDVVHLGVGGHRARGPVSGRLTGDGGAQLRLPLEAVRWGRHGLGRVRVRARRPGGLLVHDAELALPGVVRVLPGATRLDALLHPAHPLAASGVHPTRRRGPGTDFADLRPYRPGDRLRDVSWAASSRSDEPWVIVHHPERTAAVVLVPDGFTEVGVPPAALDRAARVVWSIARHHLAAGDRVGLVAAGPAPLWLPPAAGRRARWLVLDALLRSDPAGPVARRRSAGGARADDAVPPDAVVVGVSALQSDAFVATLAHHRRRGRPTAVVEVALDDLLPPAADEVERAARRLWGLDTEGRRSRLADLGIRVVSAGDDPAGAVRALARRGVPA